MPIEHASVRVVHKPWGVSDLQPWSSIDGTGDAVGELWFERADKNAPVPALLLKLLFTSEPLSIQVHPDDTFARAMGMPNGKSEAWYIISAKPDAQIGVGLKHRVTPQELRASISERLDRRTGSMASGCERRCHLHSGRHDPRHRRRHRACRNSAAQRHDIPPVRLRPRARIARRQWRSRCRRLAASISGNPIRLTAERTVLVASRHFVLERLDLPAGSSWALLAERETWILVLDGHAAIGLAAVSVGQAVFVGGGRASIEVGANGLTALVAYPASAPDRLPCCRRFASNRSKPVHTPLLPFRELTGLAEART